MTETITVTLKAKVRYVATSRDLRWYRKRTSNVILAEDLAAGWILVLEDGAPVKLEIEKEKHPWLPFVNAPT